MHTSRDESYKEGECHPPLCPQKRLDKADEDAYKEETYMDYGDYRIQQLQEDHFSVRAIEAFNVDVLLLRLLVFKRVQFCFKRLQIFFNIEDYVF